jgi:hypothetical protein
LDDPEDNSGDDHHFGWYVWVFDPWGESTNNCRDNEKPPRTVKVPAFEAQGRPITNEDVLNPYF